MLATMTSVSIGNVMALRVLA